jgi:hypothetical protein
MSMLLSSYVIILTITLMSLGIGLSISEYFPYRYKSITKLFLSPVIGLAIMMIYSIPIGYFVSHKPIFFIFLAAASLFLLILNIKKRPENLKIICIICIFMLIGASFSTLFTLIYYGQYNPFNDTWTYISQAQWLQSHPFNEKALASGFYPAFSQVTLYQAQGSRVGPSFLMALTQAGWFIKWSYYVYPAMLTVALGFGALASGSLVSLISHANKKKVLLISLTIFIMPSGFVYGALTGFYPMTFGLLFIIALSSFLSMGADHILRKNKNSFAIILASAIMFSAFLYSYNDYLPFLLLALTISFFTIIYWDKKIIKNLLIMIFYILIGTAILVNVEVERIILNLILIFTIGAGSTEIGWPIYWNPVEFIGFMSGLKSGFIGSINHIAILEYIHSIIIGLSIMAVLYIGLKNFWNRNLKIYLIIPISLICASLVVFIKMRYFTDGLLPNEQGATFLQLKTAKYASPFVLIILFSSILLFVNRFKFLRNYSLYLILLYFICSIGHNYIVMKHINGDFVHKIGSKRGFEELLDLKNYLDSELPKEKIVYLDLPGPLHKLRQMVSYVLMDRKVSGNYYDDGYITGRIPEAERNMPIEDADLVVRHKSNTFSSSSSDILASFGNLLILKNNNYALNFSERIGGYDNENDADGSWNWASKKIEYRFLSNKKTTVNINFSYTTMIDNSVINLYLYVNDDLIKNITLDNIESLGTLSEMTIENLVISKDSTLRLVFESSKNGKKIGTDPRDLNFLIKNINFSYE